MKKIATTEDGAWLVEMTEEEFKAARERKGVRLGTVLYAISVRQTGILLRASFRFHLAMDTLAFR